MTIGKQDVLDTLNQPAVKRFKFTVGSLTVSPQGYADVCQAVSDGDIDVKPGGGSDAAYDSRLNTIFTQNGNPPLNVADRAQLLHECTHAIFDAYGWVANLREDEVAAYLAQLTFMFIVNPGPFPHHLGRTGRPFADLIFGFAAVIEKYRLHELAGFGALIDPMDTAALKLLVVRMPKYVALGPADVSSNAGVPGTHSQIEGLRRALRGARRPSVRYSNAVVRPPSRKLVVF